jgi:hypothetical protein
VSNVIIADTDASEIGVYNALCSEHGGPMSPGAADNSGALSSLINDALTGAGPPGQPSNPPGGIILIPPGVYKFTNAIPANNGTGQDVGLIIKGAGGSAEFSINLSASGSFLTLMNFNSGRGIRFENLRFTFAGSPGTAITTSHCQNITCREVYFHSCQAFSTDPNSLQCGLVDCTIQYDGSTTGQTMVSLQGSEDFVRGCVIRNKAPGGASGCTGIAIGSNNGLFIDDVHVSDFDYGIMVTDGAVDSFIANTLINANVCAVQLKPSSSSHAVHDIGFSNCVFAETLLGGTGNPGNSGMVISTNGGNDSNVTGILVNSCIAYGWGRAGIEIDSGQNIVISGGQYSSNGQKSAALAAGIAIAGGSQITIAAADCSGINEFWQNNGAGAVTQPTGITINDSVESVAGVLVDCCNLQGNFPNGMLVAQSGSFTIETLLVRNCNVSGYTSYSAAVKVTGTPTIVQVSGCAGYNDWDAVSVLLNGSIAPLAPVSASTCSTPYFGPSIVNFANSTQIHVHIGGVAYLMSFGSIYLARPTDLIAFDSTPSSFAWYGR